jgi:hypothetical protein
MQACTADCLAGALGYIAREQTTKKTYPNDVITGTDHKENAHCCIGCFCVFIRCHSNGCQHMLYCLQHARHNILL